MKQLLKPIALTLALTLSNASMATTTAVVDRSGLKLVGEGVMSVLFWDVYLARFYTTSGSYQAEISPLALEFNYMMDIEANDLIEETINQWREIGLDVHPLEGKWSEQLATIWPDVNDGDQLLFRVDEQLNSRFYYNQKFVGSIESSEFSQRFAAIWLSEKTTAPKVRKKLLGK